MSVVLVCAALAGFALLYSLWVPREEIPIPRPPTPLDHLREKKKVIYDNLKDLNFEYRTGKLSDEDYQQLKTSLQYEMAVLMKSIEELESRAAGKEKAAAAEPAPAPARQRETGVCASCGRPNPPSHKHCSECGARLAVALAAVLLAMGALPAFAQRVAIEGVVRNATTGKPAAGLALTLVRAGESKDPLARAATDSQGRFRFEPVEAPVPPAMLLVQAEHGGVRYTEPVARPTSGAATVEMKIYDSGAPASSLRVADRAVILQPRSGKLLVSELYMVRNESKPPASFAPAGGTFRFYVPEGGRRSVQVSAQGAGGMPVPLEAKPERAPAGVFAIHHPFQPGENRIEVSYHLDYPGSLAFEAQSVEKVERTRLAVAQGVTAEGEGLRLLATEPQMKFGIYEVARNDRWTVKLSGEGPPAAAGGAGQGGGGEAQAETGIITVPGPVGERHYLVLAAVWIALGAGFVRLWRRERPAVAAGNPLRDKAAPGSVVRGKTAPRKRAT